MAASNYNGYCLVYGGVGALGSGCVSQFKAANWWVVSVEVWKPTVEPDEGATLIVLHKHKDIVSQTVNVEADVNILIDTSKSIQNQESELHEAIGSLLDGSLLDAVVCVAGGYIQGNINSDFVESCERMWVQNMWPSLLATQIASKYLKAGGMLCLTGAKAALASTPHAIAYGFCKSAIHQFTKSLGHPVSGLPKDTLTVCLLPVTLDTVMNRQMMPNADVSGWTPTKYITELVVKWARGEDRPANGSLVQFVTQNFNTDITIL
nr:dihydropteridine reductase-like [Onthophagus taurus]XP_022908670.1 dihydropteridine reductase-like [Onthophagus taurus]